MPGRETGATEAAFQPEMRMPPINRPMGAIEWLLLIALSLLWGASFLFSEVALEEVRPFTLVLGRVGFAALALLALVYASGHRMPRGWVAWRTFLAMGALNNLIPFSLIIWGQTEITGGLASILNATTPLFTVLLAHFLTRDERITPSRLAGLALGIAGVVAMIGPAALQGLGVHLLAQIAVLGAALAYAFAGIYGRRFRDQPPLVLAAAQVSASMLMMLPIALLVDRPWTGPLPGVATWAAILGIAILGTALAYILYFRILATAGATNLLLVTFLIPVSAVLLGATLLGERLAPEHFLGMTLIGLGLAAIDGRLLSLSPGTALAYARRVRSRRHDVDTVR
jgi:drug/metabolite transporter (DMT)-like permease